MKKVKSSSKPGRVLLHILTVLALVGISIFAPLATNNVAKASTPIPINLIYYGWFDATINQRIINANPHSLVSNSAAGPWKSNANISLFMSAGIKYYEYIDGGYENTRTGPIPTDLWSNLSYIEAAARAGAYGIFVDQVSDGVYTPANYWYLQQISEKARSLGLKVVFNTGMFSWADQLMNYCDYINSTETWSNAPLTASQSKWASRTWLLTYNTYDPATAAYLTTGAWSKGINAHYATTHFVDLPYWFESYVSQVTPYAPNTYVPPTTTYPAYVPPTTTGQVSSTAVATSGQTSVTFTSTIAGTEVWLNYAYRGVTPLTLAVPTGSHSMGFFKYGYHSNQAVIVNFALTSQSNLYILGDMQTGYTSVWQ